MVTSMFRTILKRLRSNEIRTACLIAVCFLYTGSAYMSQFYRLIPFYDAERVDLITSCLNYALQAGGMLAFLLGMRNNPALFSSSRFFTVTLMLGLPFMIWMQLAPSGGAIVLAGVFFHLLVGLYFGCYLTYLARYVPICHAGLAYGIAYAAGSIGTYLMSLIGNGSFLTSKGIVFLYLALALVTAVLVPKSPETPSNQARESDGPQDEPKTAAASNAAFFPLAAIVAIMMTISVLGSGLYYSLPQAADINWNLVRAFYAVGLVVTGLMMDHNRGLGEILSAASLVYPLIALSLIGEGLNNTVALAFSYLFRGCLTVYYVISFTDIASTGQEKRHVASLGLMISRAVEALLTWILMVFPISNLVQLIAMALLSIPLVLLLVIRRKKLSVPVSEFAKPRSVTPIEVNKTQTAPALDLLVHKALFAKEHSLTRREAEILDLLSEGLTDDEISARLYISRNTVRFHVSNILKKTKTASRLEAVRAMQTYHA